jgi:hypothetical protein
MFDYFDFSHPEATTAAPPPLRGGSRQAASAERVNDLAR